MGVLQDFFNIFGHIDFISVAVTLACGAVWGAMFHRWELDKRTVFVLLSLYLPLIIGRILYTISAGPDLTGNYLGLLYYSLYLIGALLTRKLMHGRIVDSTPETFKKIRQ